MRMRHVHLHLTDGIALEVDTFDGMMVGRRAGSPPVFDDPRSYVLRVKSAGMSLDMPSLTNLLNQQVFAYEGAPLHDLSAAVAPDGRLAIKGKLHKGLTVSFSMKATVAATPEGRLRLHTESLKAIGIPVKGLLDLVGLDLQKLVDVEKRRDISIDGDDLFVSPGTALPPPEIRGTLTKAVTAGQRLELTFGGPGERTDRRRSQESAARNYVYFGGGTIRFGKLTMEDADLQLIDADPHDAFDFFPARYQRQLVAGYSKNTPAGGLRTFMPDYDDLDRRRQTESRPPSHPREHSPRTVHPFRT